MAVSVGSNSAQLHELLADLLSDHLDRHEGPGGPSERGTQDAACHYGVALGSVTSGGPKQYPLHDLYWDGTRVLHTADVGRLLRALMSHLWAQAQAESGEDRLLVSGLALMAGDHTLVVPGELGCDPALTRHLARRGVGVADPPWWPIDPETAEIEVAEPPLDIDWKRLDRLVETLPVATRAEPSVAWGRYPVSGWVLFGPEGRHLSRAESVALVASRVVNPSSVPPAQLLGGLARMMSAVPCITIRPGPPSRVGPELADLLRDQAAS